MRYDFPPHAEPGRPTCSEPRVSLLEVRDLNVWYGLPDGGEVHAVRGVSLDLDPGERFGLVGESGSGKTTAILAMMGLLPSTASISGQVRIAGTNILDRGESGVRPYRWRDVAMVFQGAMNSLNPVRRIGWQIAQPMLRHKTYAREESRQRAAELLKRVGLPADIARRYPHELSGGMRQRVAIAMALACDPKVLLADEPTTALDVIVQAQILNLLSELSADLGLGLILVTHDLPVVAQVCDNAAVMYAGELVERGATDELYHRPRHPYTRLLFSATPDLSTDSPVISIAGAPPRLDRAIPGCPFQPRCDSALDICSVQAPALRTFDSGHQAACHLNDLSEAGHHVSAAGTRPLAPSAESGPAPTAPQSARTQSAGVLLDVHDLSVHYRLRRSLGQALVGKEGGVVRAVDRLSLQVARGEMIALIGESGCGKTTTAQAILKMIDPAGGTIAFAGTEIAHLSQRRFRPMRRSLQMVYQDPYDALDPRFRVRDIIEEALIVNKIGEDGSGRRAKVIDALERVELAPADLYLDRYPHELSGGQRQRVAIASALVLEPELLVADEPVSMLDVSVRAGVLSLLSQLRQDDRMAVVMITHDLSTAAHFADRIAVMYLGRIVEEGPARDVIANPQHPYTKALLSVLPKRDPRQRSRSGILAGEIPNRTMTPAGCRFHPRCPIAEQQCHELDPELRIPPGLPDAGRHSVACLLA